MNIPMIPYLQVTGFKVEYCSCHLFNVESGDFYPGKDQDFRQGPFTLKLISSRYLFSEI